jgi:hypothetical protein
VKTSPGIFILFQEKSKDPSEAAPALIFGHKIDPPTPPIECLIGRLFGKIMMKKKRLIMRIPNLYIKMFYLIWFSHNLKNKIWLFYFKIVNSDISIGVYS